ncbi:MAG: 4'-phosphopantetheinyl transferase superfamily protein [Ferruginibacter sp.]
MIHVFYYRMENRLPAAAYNKYFNELPVFIKEKIGSYRHWQDAERSLVGHTLLKWGLETFNIQGYSLAHLKYTEFQKPYLEAHINFNITHSGQYVLCAISDINKVGIDVEEIKEIPLIDFTQFFYEEEWQAVLNSAKQLHAFYTLWTKKEAFLKVIGSGLNVPVNQVVIRDNSIHWENETWYLNEILLDPAHVSWLCTDCKSPIVKLTAIQL